MRRAHYYRSELDTVLHHPLLDFPREEFVASVRLDALNRDVHFLQDLLEELDGVGRRAPGMDIQDPETGAAVDCCVLVDPRRDLPGIHLDPVAGDRPLIALSRNEAFRSYYRGFVPLRVKTLLTVARDSRV